jgi:hypothetical protein
MSHDTLTQQSDPDLLPCVTYTARLAILNEVKLALSGAEHEKDLCLTRRHRSDPEPELVRAGLFIQPYALGAHHHQRSAVPNMRLRNH